MGVYSIRQGLHALVPLALSLVLQVAVAEAHEDVPDDIDALIHAASIYRDVSYREMVRVLRCESNRWDRAVIEGRRRGRDGERGIAQILPPNTPAARRYGSLGALFESRTGDYSASDSIYFMAYAFSAGLRAHWHC